MLVDVADSLPDRRIEPFLELALEIPKQVLRAQVLARLAVRLSEPELERAVASAFDDATVATILEDAVLDCVPPERRAALLPELQRVTRGSLGNDPDDVSARPLQEPLRLTVLSRIVPLVSDEQRVTLIDGVLRPCSGRIDETGERGLLELAQALAQCGAIDDALRVARAMSAYAVGARTVISSDGHFLALAAAAKHAGPSVAGEIMSEVVATAPLQVLILDDIVDSAAVLTRADLTAVLDVLLRRLGNASRASFLEAIAPWWPRFEQAHPDSVRACAKVIEEVGRWMP
jgi:hypothetical protein